MKFPLKHIFLLWLFAALMPLRAQELQIKQTVSMEGSFSNGQTPLWLNANKYGLSSLSKANGYLAYKVRTTKQYGDFCWYTGANLVAPIGYRHQGATDHYTSHFILQEAYTDVTYRNVYLSIGAKERPLILRDDELSSGSQTFGKNARPIPQARLGLRDFWAIPGTKEWISFKAHLAFGVMTDGEWEAAFTNNSQYKYNRMTRYHEKAGYLRVGKEQSTLSFIVGLEMATQFGGTLYNWYGTDQNGFTGSDKVDLGNGISSYMNALLGTKSSDNGETTFKNAEGNILGSWVARLEWKEKEWSAGIYLDHFFEDHSGLIFLDYYGYGTGSEWNERKENRWFVYKPSDIQLGIDFSIEHGTWVRKVTAEYINSTYQSGPIYHDHNQTWNDHVCGIDDFYNHSRLPGWQHWGQVMGNPLYRSPQYNDNGYIGTLGNRLKAWHLGIKGSPIPFLSYRCLLSFEKNWGNYIYPFVYPQKNTSLLLEATGMLMPDWLEQPLYITAAYGQDWGKLLGNNSGFQLKIKYVMP